MSVSFNTAIRFIFLMFFLSVVFTPSKIVQAENQISTKIRLGRLLSQTPPALRPPPLGRGGANEA